MGTIAAVSGPRTFAEKLKVDVRSRLKAGFASQRRRIGLRRDLDEPWTAPEAKIPLGVRPMREADRALLLGPSSSSDSEDWLEVAWRRGFAEKHPAGCFVAVDLRDDRPCYMQWLLSPADNGFIRELGGFPPLAEGEALLENAYTPVAYRGLGIMSAAMARIAERARDLGARHVLTFVDDRNAASLRGCEKAGFRPHLVHRHRQFGFEFFARDAFETIG
jgi:RimJ/RimL family protein N-acetyltransferase